jgi:hypothetical protein
VDKIFLHNALFNYSVDGTTPSSPVFRTGYESVLPVTLFDLNLQDVISTPYSLTGVSTTSYLINGNHYFYTFPNGVSDFSKATKLVISGMFDPDGTAGPIESYRVYYPIVVNDGEINNTTHKGLGIERNYVYSISATIFRPGVLDPDKPLDPASISLTITVTNWNNITQDNEL